MTRTTRFLATGRRMAALAGLLILVAMVLTGCGQATEVAVEPTSAPTEPAEPTSAPTEPPPPTEAPTQPPTPTEVPTEPPPTDTPAPTDTPVPTDTPTPEPVDDTACISCHTDEETLKAVAKEEEEPEIESEGEG
jgi:outer membrane biosynthesis protein TonB